MKVFISNKEIEEIAYGLIQVTCGSPASGPIDIDGIARFLGLQVHYERIAEDDRDKIGFVSNGSYPSCAKIKRSASFSRRRQSFWTRFSNVPPKTAADVLSWLMKSAMSLSTVLIHCTIPPVLTGNMTWNAAIVCKSFRSV